MCDEVMDVGVASGRDDIVHGQLARRVAVSDVVADGAVEESRLLEDDSELSAQPRQVEGAHLHSIQQLSATVNITHYQPSTDTEHQLSTGIQQLSL